MTGKTRYSGVAFSHDLKRMADAGLFHVFFVLLFGRGAGIIQQIGLARILSQDELGMVVYVLRLLAIVVIFSDLGMGSGVLKFAAEPIPEEDKRVIYRTCLVYALIISLTVSTLFGCTVFLTSGFGGGEAIAQLYMFGAFYILFLSLKQIPPLYMQARKRIKVSSKISGYMAFVTTSLILFGAYSYQEQGALAFLVVGNFLSLGVFLYVTRDQLQRVRSSFAVFTRLLHFGFFSMLANSSGILNSAIGILLLKWMGYGYEEIALYGIACTVINGMQLAPRSLMRTVFPYLVSARDKPAVFAGKVSELAKKQGVTVGGMIMLTAAVGPWLIPQLFGAQYRESYQLVVIMSLQLLFWSMGAPYGHAQMALDRVRINFMISFTQLVVNVLLACWLIPQWGGIGAALAFSTSAFVQYLLLLITCRAHLQSMVDEQTA